MVSVMHSLERARLKFCSSLTFLLSSCCVATFSDILGATVLPPFLPFVLPTLADVPQGQVQLWVTVLPAIACASVLFSTPLTSWISDRSSRRKPLFVVAVVIQFVGLAFLTIGTHIALWIAGQAVLGMGSAMVWSTTLAFVVEAVPETQLARFLGYTSLSLTLGVFIGPVLGGVVYEHGGNYAVWGMVYGVFIIDLVLRLILVEPGQKSRSPDLDLADSTNSPAKNTRFAAPVLLKSPRMLSSLWVTFVQAAVLGSFDATLTVHVKGIFHWSSETAGLLYIAFVLPSFAGPWVGACADRFGGRWIAATGFLLSPVVLTCLRFVDENSVEDKVLLAALLFLLAALLATTIPIFCAEVAHVAIEIGRREPGMCGSKGAFAQSQGLWWATYTLGCTIGLLWGGFVQRAAGWSTMAWSFAILSGVTAIPVAIFLGGALPDNGDRSLDRSLEDE